FCSAGATRDLRSFPTRRSSDLGPWSSRYDDPQLRIRALGRYDDRRRAVADRVQGEVRDDAVDGDGIDLGLEVGRHAKLDVGRAGDRKSTRLNSSHRTISYAVFC